MRNIAHMKKFVETATIEIEASKGPEPARTSRASSGTSAVRPARSYGQPAVCTATGIPPEQLNSDTSRPARIRHTPALLKDFVCN